MVNECGGGWESRVRLQHRVGVVGGGGRAPGFTPISSFYNPFFSDRERATRAPSLSPPYQGLSFRPPRCIVLSEICGVVQGEFQGGGTPRSTPQVAVSDCCSPRLGSGTLPLTLEARYNT
eukprot:scaffold20031_cov65-Phaeocystis_antarctica.AAC.12